MIKFSLDMNLGMMPNLMDPNLAQVASTTPNPMDFSMGMSMNMFPGMYSGMPNVNPQQSHN